VTTDWKTIDNLLMDATWYSKGDFHDTYRTIRREDPVHWTQDEKYGHPYWAITKFEDIREVYDRWDTFSSRIGTPLPPRSGKRFTPEERYTLGLDSRAPSMDPPLHGVYRRPMNKHFSVPALAKMTARLDHYVDDLINEVAEKGEFDFIKDVAAQLPLRMIFGLLGVPEEDWKSLQDSVHRYALAADPAYTIDNDPAKTTMVGAQEVDEYAHKLALERRANPQEDLATVIGTTKIDGDILSEHEVTSWFSTIIIGGLETSRNALGTGVWQFLKNPDQRAILLEDESIVPDAVEEVLRWGSPSRTVLRVVNEDMEFRGKEMRAGDWVILFNASGNRDEDIWKDPDRFDITRERIDHIALGQGIHKCLGRNLVRLEMARFFPAFLRAFPDLTITGDPEWLADYNANGLSSLPLSHNNVVVR
jgi:cytochrome P450